MDKVIKLRKGLDIPLVGEAERKVTGASAAGTYALKPPDFHGLMPKLSVHEGDKVQAGSPLFFDKYRPAILFTSPVSGTVKQVVRGERRRILEVVVEPDGKEDRLAFAHGDPLKMERKQITETLLRSGVWPFIRQRPFDLVADPEDNPKAIFISLFDTAPLAPDVAFLLEGEERTFQTGLNALSRLTDGKLHVSAHPDRSDRTFVEGLQNVEVHWFKGPHPAGNVGVQIHHIDPLNKGEVVWVVNPQDVVIIGRLFEEGIFDPRRVVALAGSEVKEPHYYRTLLGTEITPLTDGNITGDNVRYISGNVLTGSRISSKGYLGFYDTLITVIPEGNHSEFLGWLRPGFGKFSFSRTFFSWLAPRSKKYRFDTNMHGGHRALVFTGLYEKVLPMDILMMQLLKAMIIGDIDLMENLGIYEVVEEDIALCEFIDPSKTEMQAIYRKAVDQLIKELG